MHLSGFSFRNKKQNNSRTGWREAATSGGYGIKAPRPPLPKGMRLCSHLSVSETIRRKLQRMLLERWTARPEALVDDFLEIAHSGRMGPQWPDEVVNMVVKPFNTRGERELEQEMARIYIQHEMSMWKEAARLMQAQEIGLTHVTLNTCQDQRVCATCASHVDILYPIEEAPQIPVCWNCRCYYAPIVDTGEISWPHNVFYRGKVHSMTRRQFERITR